MRPTITRPCWDWQCPYPARRGLRGYAWVHYRVFQVDPSVHIAISTAVIRRPRPSEFPTREFISQGVFGRSCFRATPAWSTRSRRGVNVRDALRAVYLTEATEPEHCRRVQTVVGKLPALPDRTWAFGPWRSNQGMGQHEGGRRRGPQRRTPPDGRSSRYMGPRNDGTRFLSRQDVAMKGVRLRTEGVGTGVLVYITGLGD